MPENKEDLCPTCQFEFLTCGAELNAKTSFSSNLRDDSVIKCDTYKKKTRKKKENAGIK